MLATPSQSQTPEEVPGDILPAAAPLSATAIPAPVEHKITRGHSCTLCAQRKVKCDRQKPCSNCVKARAECVPSAPPAPRRRRRKFSEQDIATRLRKYEAMLQKHGLSIDDDGPEMIPSPPAPTNPAFDPYGQGLGIVPPVHPNDKGILFTDKGNSRYVENTLWENFRDEIEDSKEVLDDESSDDEVGDLTPYPEPERLLLGSASKSLKFEHPGMVQIFRLWQTFLVNCNPLIKLIHAPTIQQTILDSSADLDNIPKPIEALMFNIYLLAVTSLQPEECLSMHGDTRDNLIAKYTHAAQQSLINARFMKSLSLTTLISFSFYLLAVKKNYDPHSFWILTGTAVRIAQQLGAHRDGADLDIPPFEAEMRRRIWWQLSFLDGQASKLAGAGFPTWLVKFNTQLPLNLNDSDISPNMKELPADKEGITEMLFCRLRYEVALTLKSTGTWSENGKWKMPVGPELIAAKDKAINDLETRFHEKYIQYCDPSIPLHLLAMHMSRSIICTLRLMAHHPRQYPDKGASMPQKEKDMLFELCAKELEISSVVRSDKTLSPFRWHLQVHFQLDAFIYLLSELRTRFTGESVERAWNTVELVFDLRPEMISEVKNNLYFAIGSLTLKAWKKYEESSGGKVPPPRFISILRSQRRVPEPAPQTTEYRQENISPRTETTPNDMYTLPYSNGYLPTNNNTLGQWNNTDFNMDLTMPDTSMADWEYYQTLLLGSDLPTYNPGQSQDPQQCQNVQWAI